MARLTWFRRAPAGISFVVWLALLAPSVSAEEPVGKFLDALRRNGYYDEAAAYLEQQRAAASLPPVLQETFDYELGVTLIQSAQPLQPPAERQSWRWATALSPSSFPATRSSASMPS